MHYECTKSARFYAIIGKRECDLMFPKNVRFHEVSSAKRKKKKKREQHETLILKWIWNIEFHVDRSGEKTGSRKDRGQKGIYSIHFKRARLREKESFTILVLRYTYNSIRKHASQVWRFHDASFVSQVCTVRGNLRVAAMKITRYNWNWLCLDL